MSPEETGYLAAQIAKLSKRLDTLATRVNELDEDDDDWDGTDWDDDEEDDHIGEQILMLEKIIQMQRIEPGYLVEAAQQTPIVFIDMIKRWYSK